MEIKCRLTWWFGGCCDITNQVISDDQDLKFVGNYEEGKTNLDVREVAFYECAFTKIPQRLTIAFPNLKTLYVESSKIKDINRNDLAEYKNLEKISFHNNDIQFLPGDLFMDFKNLRYISFAEKKLKVIEPNILDGLDLLNDVYFKGNTNYDLKFNRFFQNRSNEIKSIKNAFNYNDIFFHNDLAV